MIKKTLVHTLPSVAGSQSLAVVTGSCVYKSNQTYNAWNSSYCIMWKNCDANSKKRWIKYHLHPRWRESSSHCLLRNLLVIEWVKDVRWLWKVWPSNASDWLSQNRFKSALPVTLVSFWSLTHFASRAFQWVFFFFSLCLNFKQQLLWSLVLPVSKKGSQPGYYTTHDTGLNQWSPLKLNVSAEYSKV